MSKEIIYKKHTEGAKSKSRRIWKLGICAAVVVCIAAGYIIYDRVRPYQYKNVYEREDASEAYDQVLSAADIAELDIEYGTNIPIQAILEGKLGYRKWTKEYQEILQEAIDSEEATLNLSAKQAGEEPPLLGAEGYYVSVLPIRHWNAYMRCMERGSVDIAVLDKEKQPAAVLHFTQYQLGYIISVSRADSTVVLPTMAEYPERKFIPIYNGLVTLAIDEENTLYRPVCDVRIEGDYYHTLDYEAIAISYDMLTAEENLIWIAAK